MKNILISFLLAFSFSQERLVDGIVAVVGDNVITQNDFFQQLSVLSEQRGINPSSMPIKYEVLAENLLSNIVNQYVLLEHAKKDTIIVLSGSEVQEQLDKQMSLFINEVGSVAALEDVFGKTFREIKSDYWDEIYNAMLIERYRYFLISGLSVGKKEVDLFYNLYKDSLPLVPKRANFSLLNINFSPSFETVDSVYKFVSVLNFRNTECKYTLNTDNKNDLALL